MAHFAAPDKGPTPDDIAHHKRAQKAKAARLRRQPIKLGRYPTSREEAPRWVNPAMTLSLNSMGIWMSQNATGVSPVTAYAEAGEAGRDPSAGTARSSWRN